MISIVLVLLLSLVIVNGLTLKSHRYSSNSIRIISSKSRLYNNIPKSNRDNIISNTNDILSISSKVILSSSILASSTLLQTSSALAAADGNVIVLGANGKTGKIAVELLKTKGMAKIIIINIIIIIIVIIRCTSNCSI